MPARLYLTISGLPRDNDEYVIDMPPHFTMAEENILYDMARCRSGQFFEEIEKGSLAVVLATLAIAMRRAGIRVPVQAFENVSDEQIEARWEADEAAAPLVSENGTKPDASTTSSSKPGSPSSTPSPESTGPSSIGAST